MKHRRILLDEIEREVLNQNSSLAGALRKCVALGGHAGSRELRDWAARELSGYEPTASDIPEYRTVPAVLKLDGSNLRFQVTGQPISPNQLPDFARHDVKEQVVLYHGVGELEAMLEKAKSNEGALNLSFPGASDLVAYMNTEADYGTAVHRVYHQISGISVAAVLERIRTALTELVAELRDGHTDAEGVPSPEAAAQALNVAVHGHRNRVRIVNAQAGGSLTAPVPAPAEKDPWWKRWQVLSALVAGAATLTTAAIALSRTLGG